MESIRTFFSRLQLHYPHFRSFVSLLALPAESHEKTISQEVTGKKAIKLTNYMLWLRAYGESLWVYVSMWVGMRKIVHACSCLQVAERKRRQENISTESNVVVKLYFLSILLGATCVVYFSAALYYVYTKFVKYYSNLFPSLAYGTVGEGEKT